MTKTSKLFLLASMVTFAVGMTGPGSDILGGLLKPLAAILFMLFFITHLFSEDMAKFDDENRSRISRTRNRAKVSSGPSASGSAPSAAKTSGAAA
jgi:hypothetical protein